MTANLFLLLLLLLAVSADAKAQNQDVTETLSPDSVFVSTFSDFAPLLNAVAEGTVKKKESLRPGYIVLLDSSLRFKADSLPVLARIKPFFAPHALKTHKFQKQRIPWSGNEISFVVIFLGFVMLAAAHYYYGKRLFQIIRACANSRFLAQLMRNGDLYNEQISIYLFVIYLLCIPLLILEVNHYYLGYSVPSGPLGMASVYLLMLGAFAALYGLKILAIRFAGIIFKTYATSQEYILVLFVFNLFEGMLILVLLLWIIFADSFMMLQICLLVLALIFAYRLIRAFFLGLSETKYSFLYLLLFFTTIEVLPTVILIKLIMKFLPA